LSQKIEIKFEIWAYISQLWATLFEIYNGVLFVETFLKESSFKILASATN